MTHKKRSLEVTFRVALGLIIVIIGGAIITKACAPSNDCLHHASARLNILLDRSARYNEFKRKNLDRTIGDLVRGAQSNSQINVFYMTDDGERPKTVISLCRPNNVNVWVGDPDEVRFQIRKYVTEAIRKVTDLPHARHPQAPLVETLDTLSRDRLLAEENGQNQVYIFSPMMQNSVNGTLSSCTTLTPPRLPNLEPYVSAVSQFYRDVPVHIFELVGGNSETPNRSVRRCVRMFWEATLPNIASWQPL